MSLFYQALEMLAEYVGRVQGDHALGEFHDCDHQCAQCHDIAGKHWGYSPAFNAAVIHKLTFVCHYHRTLAFLAEHKQEGTENGRSTEAQEREEAVG